LKSITATEESSMANPLVGIIMGSRSDWPTMEHASKTLDSLRIPHEVSVISAHRAPDKLFAYVSGAAGRGMELLIAAAGGAAHLPGVTAAKTALPVIGVPMESSVLHGVDSLLSIVQMPAGIPVATMAIGKAGAINAALFSAAILGLKHSEIRDALTKYRADQTAKVLAEPDPRSTKT
jgi:5-(carboxyamino)imidazole ribonucleotide mutase